MKRFNQKGFTLIEGLLIIIALALVGFIGFYVYNANKKSEDKASQATQQSSQPAAKKEEPKDESASWKEIVSLNKAFSMRVPDGWKLTNDPEQDRFISSLDPNDLTYKKGQAAVITNISILGSDAPHRFSIGIYDQSILNEAQSTVTDFASVSGVKGKKSVNIGEDLLNGTGTTKRIAYSFEKNGKFYSVNYMILQGDPDNTEVVEKAIKTLKF